MTTPPAPDRSPSKPALSGIRVLDLTTVVFGPYASQILADYGADVIKVESREGDSTRQTGPRQEEGLAAIFLGVNRNKRSIVLDLKTADGRQALLELVAQADVLMHSMRPHKMQALGLDPETLCAQHPRLIYAGLYGFGVGGAYDGRPAYDDIVQGLCGLADTVARQTGEPGYLPTIAADKTCALMAAHAVLAALFQRERDGVGQQIEVPMFEAMTSYVLVEHLYGRHMADPRPGQDGEGAAEPAGAANGPSGMTAHGAQAKQPRAPEPTAGYPRVLVPWRRPYRTQDGYLCLMPYTDAHWQAFFRNAGHPRHADDPRFAGIAQRTRHIAALYELVGAILLEHPTAYWQSLCDAWQIPNAAINRLDDLERDPHLQSVEFFAELDHGDHRYRFTRNPVRLSRSQVDPAMPPGLGEHTVEVLRESGWPQSRIEALIESGAAVQAER